MEAYKPYWVSSGVQCSKCKRIFTLDEITASHVFSVGSCYQLKAHPRNLLPDCWRCHTAYDTSTTAEKKKTIDRIEPGRWEELVELAKELGTYDSTRG